MIARSSLLSVGLFAGIATAGFSIAYASSHSSAEKLRKEVVEIDMMVTGANNSVGAPAGLNSKNSKSECPLCFHRDLYKLEKGKLPVDQAYPGDQ